MAKWIGIGIASCAVIGIGFWKAEMLRQRLKYLCTIALLIEMLKGEIEYAVSSMDEVCESISKRLETPFSDFFFAVGKELKEMKGETLEEIWTKNTDIYLGQTSLWETDLSMFKSIGSRLGYLDSKMQMRILIYAKEEVQAMIDQLNKTTNANVRLYQSLGILGALSLIVITV